GWNQIENKKDHPLLAGLENGTYFYFVHSYHIIAEDATDVIAETEYGIRYPSICARGAITGVQFHPEKNPNAGLRLMANFAGVAWAPKAESSSFDRSGREATGAAERQA